MRWQARFLFPRRLSAQLRVVENREAIGGLELPVSGTEEPPRLKYKLTR